MPNKLILPTLSTEATYEDSVVRTSTFEDDTRVDEVIIFPGDEPVHFIQNPDGSLVEDITQNRHPFSERLARTVVQTWREANEASAE